MRRLVVLSAVAVALVVALPANATAATDFGNSCIAASSTPNATSVMATKSPLNPLPIAAPVDGVITKATFNLPVIGTTVPTVVKTVRATGVPNQYSVVSQSASIPLAGSGSFDVRIPVTAGDLLAIYSSLATLQCTTADATDVVGQFAGEAGVGSTNTFAPATNRALPLVATIEPDADGDGFGDETQDKCPQAAAFQSECPVVILDSFAAPEKNSMTVLVTTTSLADVTVAGTVKVKKQGKGGKGKRKSSKIKLSGGTQTIKAGAMARFTVSYPGALRKALKKVPTRGSLKATLTATATDVIGRVTTDKSKAKLSGLKR